MKERILITGASGYLGSFLYSHFSAIAQQTFGVYHTHNNVSDKFVKCDLRNRSQLTNLVDSITPSIVIHSAALTDLDQCEKNPILTHEVNVGITRNLLEILPESTKIIYISSEAIFDGETNKPYTENDPPNPINTYGLTKLVAEKEVSASGRQHLICRVGRIVGQSSNFETSPFDLTLEKLKAGHVVEIDNERIFTPTWNQHLAEALTWWITQQSNSLILNVSTNDSTSYYSFMKNLSNKINLPGQIAKKSIGTYFAPRPIYTPLSTKKLISIGAPSCTIAEATDGIISLL